MPKLTKTDALVLKRRAVLQKDVVVTLFTKELGKIRAVAKGIKQITSRRSPHVQTGNLIHVLLSRGGSGYYLQSTDLISGFTTLKDSSEKLEYLYTFFFIIDRLLPEEQNEVELFNVTKAFLVELSKSSEGMICILQKYLYMTLVHMGYINDEKPLDELIMVVEEIINEKVPTNVIM